MNEKCTHAIYGVINHLYVLIVRDN